MLIMGSSASKLIHEEPKTADVERKDINDIHHLEGLASGPLNLLLAIQLCLWLSCPGEEAWG